MKLFENYLTGIDYVLENKSEFEIYKGKNVTQLLMDSKARSFNGSALNMFSAERQLAVYDDSSKAILTVDKNELERYFGPNKLSFPQITIGKHPDFENLGYNDIENHYCVSMFVDIKGSTKLALTHSLEEVRLIKDSLLTLCIHVANFFGGHVHRLQGDAAFIQFVRRGEHPNDSIINALNASSVLCQFVSTDLATLFEQRSLNPIKIRVGIDYGQTDKVLWSYYGIHGCNELTTTSLHTDLAAKLQAKADNNSIRIGKNVVDTLDLPEELYSTPTKSENGKNIPDYYILQSTQLNYNQYVFDWTNYLNGFDFFKKNNFGKLEINQNIYSISCEIDDMTNSGAQKYYQNSHSIPKGNSLKFKLLRNGIPYFVTESDSIIWEVFNRGKEATLDKNLKLDFDGTYNNKNYCVLVSAYLGNHILKCTIKRKFSTDNIVLKFHVFVQ